MVAYKRCEKFEIAACLKVRDPCKMVESLSGPVVGIRILYSIVPFAFREEAITLTVTVSAKNLCFDE